MKKITIILLFLSYTCYAQNDSLKSYFPLHIGDYWQYKGTHITSSDTTVDYINTEVLKDTLIGSMNQTYYKLRVGYSPYPYGGDSIKYYRYDSSSQSIYEYHQLENNEALFFRLNSKLNDTWRYSNVEVGYFNDDTINVFDKQEICKVYTGSGPPIWSYALAKYFGPIRIIDDESWGFLFYNVYNLIYAKIDGIEYGKYVTYIKNSTDNSSPNVFKLYQNYPNPFNPVTRINYSVPQRSYIKLVVYNILGETIRILFEGEENAGNYSISFNGSNLPSGIYIYCLKNNKKIYSRKMILLK